MDFQNYLLLIKEELLPYYPRGFQILQDSSRHFEPFIIETFESFFKEISFFSKAEQLVLVSAFFYALEKHEDQFYLWKNGKKISYGYHVVQAALHVLSFSKDITSVFLALWHDLLEDKRVSKKEVLEELDKYSYSLLTSKDKIILSLELLDKNNSSSLFDYYSQILKDPQVLVAKAGDLVANLNASLVRYDEMILNEQRFWIYEYLYIIYFIILPRCKNKSVCFTLLNISKDLQHKFDAKILLEFQEYCIRRNVL